MGAMLILKCFSTILYVLYTKEGIYYLPFESLSNNKKLDQNPLGRLKDLCIHRDRQQEATLITLCYDYNDCKKLLCDPILC
jgi:hypothetical protein